MPRRLSLVLTTVLLLGATPGLAEEPGAEPPDWPFDWTFDHPVFPQRGRIGVRVQSITPELREHFAAPRDRGVLVSQVDAGKPADAAGLAVGDVVVAAGETPVDQPIDLVRAVGRVPAGSSLDLHVVRSGKERTVVVEPEGEASRWLDPEAWDEWLDQSMRRGSRGLRRRLDDLERRLEELERDRDLPSEEAPETGRPT